MKKRKKNDDDYDYGGDAWHLGVMAVFCCYIINEAAVKLPAT